MKNDENERNGTALPRASPAIGGKTHLLHFDGFTLDLQRHSLMHGSQRVELSARPLELLTHFACNPDCVLEKQHLLDVVWKDACVTEDSLVQAVREIRRVLGDEKSDPHFIQTVPRRGYRFIATVTMAEAAEKESADQEPAKSALGFKFPTWPSGRHSWIPMAFWIVLGLSAIASAIILIGPILSPKLLKPALPMPGIGLSSAIRELSPGGYSATKPAISPDGKYFLFNGREADASGPIDLFMLPINGGNLLRVTDHADPSGDMPVFAPEGNQIVFSRFRSGQDGSTLPDLWIVRSFGGPYGMYISNARGVGFSPDGKWIAWTKIEERKKVLQLAPIDHLEEKQELGDPGFNPRWSPDGKWLAYTTSDPEGGMGILRLVSFRSRHEKNLTAIPEQIYGFAWTLDSRSLVFSSRRNGAFHLYRIDVQEGIVTQLTLGIGDYYSPVVTPDGTTLVFCHTKAANDLMLADGVANAEAHTITHDEYHRWPRLSPSGRQVASVVRRPDFDEYLFVTDLYDGRSIRLSSGPVTHPCWLDEENIAFLQRGPTARSTRALVVNVPARVESTWLEFPDEAEWLAVHPNRKQVAVVLRSADGVQRIILREPENANTGDKVIAEGGDYHHLRWVPGQAALSWSGPEISADEKSSGIWLMELGQMRLRQLCKDGYEPVWNRDGSAVYFSRYPRIPEQAALWRLETGSNHLTKIRSWGYTTFHDMVGDRLVFVAAITLSRIYSMSLP